ncbi:hypothetical protein [Blastococcus goldschmidtiae]|uniref:hypothetical protein n=1 Tax=Blastococcus goldschmidtiae TaxID=3075546 RepID=UPI0037C0D4BE
MTNASSASAAGTAPRPTPELHRRGIVSVIPEPRDQQGHRKRRGSAGGRPVTYDPATYKGRNVVERAFCLLKQWRALATRCDKHAVNYRGGAVLAAILTWLRTDRTSEPDPTTRRPRGTR